jgi:hypothetical protein
MLECISFSNRISFLSYHAGKGTFLIQSLIFILLWPSVNYLQLSRANGDSYT